MNKLITAYAGIDASAPSLVNTTAPAMSKHGSPYLCTALFQATLTAERNGPVFCAYNHKKRAEANTILRLLALILASNVHRSRVA